MKFELKLLDWWWNKQVLKSDQKRAAKLTKTTGVSAIKDLDYFGDGSKWHLMDVYRPNGTENEKLPVIIDIHGGGWMYGDKDLNAPYCEALAKRGFVVVSFSYSLFPSVTLPVPVQEIFRAINFVYDNAERFNIDLNNAFITGDSAGGHYAGLVLSIIADEELEKLYEVEKCRMTFKGVAFTCAAFYPNSIANFPVHLAKTYVGLFYGGAKKYEKHKFYKSVDIINNKVEKFPPMFINSCFNDMLKGDTNRFIECLDRKKIPYTLDFPTSDECENKMGHVYAVLYPEDFEESKKTIDKTCEFFKEQMNK